MKKSLTDKLYNYGEKFRNQPYELENNALGAEFWKISQMKGRKNGRTH